MKRIFLLLTTGFTFLTAQAQVPQKMNYQAVIRDASQALLTSAPVGVRISVLQGSATGTAVFVETHTANTNANGLLTLEIGNGTAQTGTFAGIDWSLAPYFLQTETDPTGGTNYTLITTSEMLSVPYALYAATSGNPIPGKSAYQEWLDQGNTGTEADFLTSLTGAQGSTGANGQSAYDIWLSLGNTGTETDFINSLTGPQGAQGIQGPQGIQGVAGTNGTDGSGAYTNWLNQGNTGTEADFLATLVGPQGPPGTTLVNGGKHTLILTDDINDADAAQQIADEVGPNTQEILIDDCTQLTTVDLSGISKAVRVTITDNSVLTNVNLGNLTVVYDNFQVANCPNLSTLNISALQKISSGVLLIKNTGITALNLPDLKKVNGGFTVENNDALVSLTTPQLSTTVLLNVLDNLLLQNVSAPLNINESVLYLKVNANAALTSLSLPGLMHTGSVEIMDNPVMTSLDLTALDSVKLGVTITGNSSLNNLSISNLRTAQNFTLKGGAALGSLNLSLLDLHNSNNEKFEISDITGLTALDISSLTNGYQFKLLNNTALTTLTATNLGNYSSLHIEGNTSLSALNLPAFGTGLLSEVLIINNGVSSISLPALSQNYINWTLVVANNPNLVSLSAPSFKYISQLVVDANPMLTSIDFSNFQQFSSILLAYGTYGRMAISNNTSLTALSLPSMNSLYASSGFGMYNFSGNTNLSSLNFPALNNGGNVYGTVDFRNCALPSSDINMLLSKFVVSSNFSVGSKLYLESQTPPAPPTGQGITDKATMITNGWTVTTD